MKKIRFLVIFVIIFMCLSVTAFAEGEIVPDTSEGVTVEEEVQTPTAEDPLPDNMTTEDAEDIVDDFLSKIEDLSTWVYVTFSGISIGAIAIITKVGLNKIVPMLFDLFKKSDKNMDDRFTKYENEFGKQMNMLVNTVKTVKEELNSETTNLEKTLAVLTIFIMNSNESASAKAEMMELISGLKKYDGEISEIVAKAQEAIDSAKAEKKASLPATPDLDKLIEEETAPHLVL
jgi:hypothetical protein